MTKENRAKRYKTYQERAATEDITPGAQNLKKGAEWQLKWMEREYPNEFGVKEVQEVVEEEVKSKGKK